MEKAKEGIWWFYSVNIFNISNCNDTAAKTYSTHLHMSSRSNYLANLHMYIHLHWLIHPQTQSTLLQCLWECLHNATVHIYINCTTHIPSNGRLVSIIISTYPEAEKYSEYVREKLGDILSTAVADVAEARPEDPIGFLAQKLHAASVGVGYTYNTTAVYRNIK